MPSLDHQKYIYLNSAFRYEAWRDEEDKLRFGFREAEIKEQYETPSLCHIHGMLEFIYVVSGCGQIIIDGQVKNVTANTFIAVSCFVPHHFTRLDSSSWLVIIPARYISACAPLLEGKTFSDPIVHDGNGEILACIQLINAIYSRTGIYADMRDGNEELLSSALMLLLRSAIAVCGLKDKPRSSYILLDAVDYIHKHFREPIRIAELSRMLLCNQYALSSQFSRTFGMTISEYITRLRVTEVRRMMTETPEMTLPEAAERAGFGSLRTLHRAYKAEFGCTPAGDRKK